MIGEGVVHLIFSYALSIPIMGSMVKASGHGFVQRLPCALTIAFFMGLQAANWQKPSQEFHDLMT